MFEILLLSRQEIQGIFAMKDGMKAVEEAYRAQGEGRVVNPLATSFHIRKYQGEIDIKPGYIEPINAAGVKYASAFWENPSKYNLPSVIGIIILTDAENGVPLAIMDGTHTTAIRTGAAGGVAAKYLARKNSENVGIIGTGTQGRMQLLSLCENFNVKNVKAYDKDKARSKKYADEMAERLGINVAAVDRAEEAVTDADIIVTVTPSTSPIVMSEWVSPGTHINAIGADMPGKQELDVNLVKRARIVVDLAEQCKKIGEIQTAYAQGVITDEDIYAEIGEIVAGKKKGRVNDEEITLFDSTGLGIQDVSSAYYVYQTAKERKIGKLVEFL